MKHLILVDPCRLHRNALYGVRVLRAGRANTQLIVVGVEPRISLWEQDIDESNGDRIVRPQTLARGATQIALTAEAMKCAAGEARHWQWTLIGDYRGYLELTQRLEEEGIDIEYYSTISVEEAEAIVGKRPALAQKMRELASDMQAEKPDRAIPVGQFADTAVQRFPELRKKKNRMNMFGAVRFSSIARAIGLRVAGHEIVDPG